MNIGEVIKEYRKCNNWSAKDLAKRAGVTQRAISYWENGRRKPSYENVKKVLDALDYEIKIVKKQ